MVKCSECGFLASRNLQSRQLEETEPEIREEGALSIAWNTDKPFDKYEPPICFMQVPDFDVIPYSLQFVLQRDKEKEKIRAEIQRERMCESFIEWRLGATPKEHREMLDRKEMLKWQAEREESDRKWRTRQQWFMVIVAGIFTILGVIIGILAKSF